MTGSALDKVSKRVSATFPYKRALETQARRPILGMDTGLSGLYGAKARH
jgi:hypothetical protein